MKILEEVGDGSRLKRMVRKAEERINEPMRREREGSRAFGICDTHDTVGGRLVFAVLPLKSIERSFRLIPYG